MKPEAQRIAIAKITPGVRFVGNRILWPNKWKAFDPLNDLNAMHEAEKVILDKGYWCEYVANLIHVLRAREGYKDAGALSEHAKASYRAEAFLKTLNLWREE